MKRFNLIEDVPSLRNTVRPDTPEPGDKKKRSVSPLLVILFLCSVLLVLEPYMVEFLKDMARVAPQEIVSTANKPVSVPAKMPVPAFAPPKDDDSIKIAPVVSRPVALDFIKEKAAKKVAKPAPWELRFALCVYRASCESVRVELKKTGVESHIVEGRAKVGVYRVMTGPWPTASHAEEARLQLKSKAVEGNEFVADNHYYLLSDAMPEEKVASAMLNKIREMGLRAEMAFKREPRKVYKVYSGGFPDEETAKAEKNRLASQGIDSVVEKRK